MGNPQRIKTKTQLVLVSSHFNLANIIAQYLKKYGLIMEVVLYQNSHHREIFLGLRVNGSFISTSCQKPQLTENASYKSHIFCKRRFLSNIAQYLQTTRTSVGSWNPHKMSWIPCVLTKKGFFLFWKHAKSVVCQWK